MAKGNKVYEEINPNNPFDLDLSNRMWEDVDYISEQYIFLQTLFE